MKPYPLLLKPPIKDYLWGGTRLITDFGFETTSAKAAEAWVLSCHKDGASLIANGELAGHTLPEALDQWGDAAVGDKAAAFPYFPILIKLIDARDRLSVQVHPDDAYAMRVEGEFGKTEMWYVVDCEPGAALLYGFSRGLTQEEFRRRIETDTLEEVCNRVPVKKGTCSLSRRAPCTPLAPVSLSPRCSRTPTPPTGSPITAAWARTASPVPCMWIRP